MKENEEIVDAFLAAGHYVLAETLTYTLDELDVYAATIASFEEAKWNFDFYKFYKAHNELLREKFGKYIKSKPDLAKETMKSYKKLKK